MATILPGLQQVWPVLGPGQLIFIKFLFSFIARRAARAARATRRLGRHGRHGGSAIQLSGYGKDKDGYPAIQQLDVDVDIGYYIDIGNRAARAASGGTVLGRVVVYY